MLYRVIVEAEYDDEDIIDNGTDPADPNATLPVEKVTALAIQEMFAEAQGEGLASGGLIVRAVPCGDDGEPTGPAVSLAASLCRKCGGVKASVIDMKDQ